MACPFCQARFLIPASAFAFCPRRVRCGRCLHSWEADMPKEIDVVAPPLMEVESVAESPAQEPTPIPQGSNLPALVKKPWPVWANYVLLGAAVFVILSLVLILNRQTIAGRWPMFEATYNAFGLHINHTGEGIHIEDVRSELRYDSGIVRLVVEGKLHNVTGKHQLVPNIRASAKGPDGSEIQGWQIDAPVATLAPDEVAPFEATIKAPDRTVVDVDLEFIELKNAAD